MATLEVEFEVFCVCGNELSAKATSGNDLEVEPCEKCIAEGWDEGNKEGYNECEKDNDL